MLFQGFWSISITDILVIVGTIFIFIASKYYDKYKEKKEVKFLFLRIKKLFESIVQKGNSKEQYFADLPYLKTVSVNLIKLGVVPVIREKRTILQIVYKYISTGIELKTMNNERLDLNKQNFEIILKEMLDFAEENFKININKKFAIMQI